jgi:hypothetical protein
MYVDQGAIVLMYLLSLVVSVVCAVIGAGMARRRSRPAWAGALLGLWLNVIGIALIAIVGPKRPDVASRPDLA